jgi:hypothetical protein
MNSVGSFGSFRVLDSVRRWLRLGDHLREDELSRWRSFFGAPLYCRRIEREYFSSYTISAFHSLFTERQFFSEASTGMIGRRRS